jgi:NAD(P)-dependent dehydrogenase (short-subunit alcohol dehydrogenase family)
MKEESPPDEFQPLKGKTAIVTGASRGIGLSIAQRLSNSGANVCITARKIDPLREALATLRSNASIAVAGRSDDDVHRTNVFDEVADRFGHLDILVNNVGINTTFGPLMDLDLVAARKIIEVNVLATLAWIQGAHHHERLNFAAGGCVINVSSVAAQTPSPGLGFYGISKAAIDHLTRTLANELGPDVRVNAVAPAVITTDFSTRLYEGKEEKIARRYPMKRLGLPSDVSGVVAFLASPDANWITGQVLTVDGGLIASGGSA